MKRILSMLILLSLIVSALVIIPAADALAGISLPNFSASAYCEFIARTEIPVFRNSSRTTRGTCSPASSYNAYVDPNDVCYILKAGSSWLQISYPTPSGRKQGYIDRNAVFPSAPAEKAHIYHQYNTLKKPGGAVYGYVENGDTAWRCGSSGSYYAIVYTAKSGSRAYKLGWMSPGDFNAAKGNSNPNAAKIQKIINYAKGHYNDGKGLCAEFVADCLKQAGINIPNNASYYPASRITLAGNRLNAYTNPYTCSEAQLLWFKEKGYKIITNPKASDVNLGDVAFMHSSVADGHVVVITGKTASGNYTYSAHNKSRLKQTVEYSGTYRLTFLVKINYNDSGITPIQ